MSGHPRRWKGSQRVAILALALGCRTADAPAYGVGSPAADAPSWTARAEPVLARIAPASNRGLEARLNELAAKAEGRVGISVLHIESGRAVEVGGNAPMPMQSVFKLPISVVVLREAQAARLDLGRTLSIAAKDVSPGVKSNRDRWRSVPRVVTVKELLEYALVDSDNTSADKLLALVGGPATVTESLQTLGLRDIVVRGPTTAGIPNEATPSGLTQLLAAITRGDVLQPAYRALLWGMMTRARVGERRLRAGLPPGTPLVEKSGTGRSASATNDVGVATLPDGRGHLAIAVLISGSSLSGAAQEGVIAEVARAAFETYSQE